MTQAVILIPLCDWEDTQARIKRLEDQSQQPPDDSVLTIHEVATLLNVTEQS